MNCPNCGHATSSETTRCGHCNFKLPANPKPQAAAQGITVLPCWNCRHPNSAESERCEHCNAKLQVPGYAAAARKPINVQTRKPVNVSNHDE